VVAVGIDLILWPMKGKQVSWQAQKIADIKKHSFSSIFCFVFLFFLI
jgi:hypothetical protein